MTTARDRRARRFTLVVLVGLAMLALAPAADAKHHSDRQRIWALEKQVAALSARLDEVESTAGQGLALAKQAQATASRVQGCLRASPAGVEMVLSSASELLTAGGVATWQPVNVPVVTTRGGDFLAYVSTPCALFGVFPLVTKP